MSRIVVVFGVFVAVILAVTASANLLLNPGFESGSANDADNWWRYNHAGRESWANRSGSFGMAFWSWVNGAWGGFGQDVVTNLPWGTVLSFSIYGLAEQNYQSSTAETWLKIEYWQSGNTTWTKQDTLDVYGLLTANRENWVLCTIVVTNELNNVVMVKPIVGGGGFTNNNVGNQAVKWDDAELLNLGVIPEPTIAGLLGFAGLLLAAMRWKARK